VGTDDANPIRVSAPAKFLTAEWRYVAMLNYAVDAGLIARFVPPGTETDLWQGKAFISLVGFRFLQTKVMGVPIPFHRDFDEVNLRLYVRRQQGSEVRRGVVFVREIVPRWAVAQIARTAYNENYVALPMSHTIETQFAGHVRVEYSWQTSRGWNRLSLTAQGEPQRPEEGSQEQFIAEHYWGYTKQRDGCAEYRVDHASWRLWSSHDARFEGDAEELYGRDLAQVLATPPTSAFLAEGSAVTLYRRRRIAS
jgi:uncharacterized protein